MMGFVMPFAMIVVGTNILITESLLAIGRGTSASVSISGRQSWRPATTHYLRRDSLADEIAPATDDWISADMEKRRRPRKRNRDNGGPYGHLSTEDLQVLTEYHLSQNIDNLATVGSMTSAQMHEFSRLIATWAKIRSHQRQERILASEMAEQCLREVLDEKAAGNAAASSGVVPEMYLGVIQSWLKVKSGRSDLVHATSILNLLERLHSTDEVFMSRSAMCYIAVLDGWCRSKSRGAEIRAQEILIRMSSAVSSTNGTNGNFGVDVRHYNNVMNRIASSPKPKAGKEAERLLMSMIDKYNSGEASLLPNRNSFNTVIKAYSNAGGKHAAANAKRILELMKNPETIGLERLKLQLSPDVISFSSVMATLTSGHEAEELMAEMVELCSKNSDMRPDTVAYNTLIKVWGRSGDEIAGERSEAILNQMLDVYRDGSVDVRPDDVTYNSVIHNVANSNVPDSPHRARRLLEQMKKSYESGIIAVEPNIITYNSVLDAFAKSGRAESAKMAEELLFNIEESSDKGASDIEPDLYSYNIVINAWGSRGVATKAVHILDHLTSRSIEGRTSLTADVTTYNSVLHAWSQSSDRNAAIKALGLLEIMLKLAEGRADLNVQPNAYSFSTCINAFSKSKFPRKARQTRDLLRRMKKLSDDGQKNMRPNIYVYTAVLNACAYTFGRREEKEEALSIGLETFEELRQSGIGVNHVAYGSFIRLCRTLMQEKDARRNHFITRAFRQCCSDGQVGDYVLRQLRPIPDVYASSLKAYIDREGKVVKELPVSWTCNVCENRRRSNRKPTRRKR